MILLEHYFVKFIKLKRREFLEKSSITASDTDLK